VSGGKGKSGRKGRVVGRGSCRKGEWLEGRSGIGRGKW